MGEGFSKSLKEMNTGNSTPISNNEECDKMLSHDDVFISVISDSKNLEKA